jgi:Flp pilus assembly pilin Flp
MQEITTFPSYCGYYYLSRVDCSLEIRLRGRQARLLDLKFRKGGRSMGLVHRLWREQQGQDIAEYAVMLAVILIIVVGTVRLIGSNANNVFSSVASSIQ